MVPVLWDTDLEWCHTFKDKIKRKEEEIIKIAEITVVENQKYRESVKQKLVLWEDQWNWQTSRETDKNKREKTQSTNISDERRNISVDSTNSYKGIIIINKYINAYIWNIGKWYLFSGKAWRRRWREWTCGHSGGIEDGTNGESSTALPCVK